jgi:integrase
VTWKEFRRRFESEKLPSLSRHSRESYGGTFAKVEKYLRPRRLAELTSPAVSAFQARLRESGLKETSIASHLRHLKAALNWAKSVEMLVKVPDIKMPRRGRLSKMMKGRPIAPEEFERMLEKVPDVVGERGAPYLRNYLRGMWWSGLRLSESLELYWDRTDRLYVDFGGLYPMLRISGEFEKGNRDRLLPMAPEFAHFLEAFPKEERQGKVFKFLDRYGKPISPAADWIGKMVALVGRKAGVRVNTDSVTGKIKYASVHDLRRSFGERWAGRVLPPLLKELMRHESIDTTLRFYVGQNAERAAKVLWESTPGVPRPKDVSGAETPIKAECLLPETSINVKMLDNPE